MILTDTHTHLYSEQFTADRAAVIERSIKAGVTRFFIPAIDSEYTQSMLDLEDAYPENVFLMMGLHPTHVKDNVEEELTLVKNGLTNGSFMQSAKLAWICIGTGLLSKNNNTLSNSNSMGKGKEFTDKHPL